MKSQQKATVTLSMLWIGAMVFASQPSWVRNVIAFVSGATGHTVSSGGYKGDTTGVTHGH